LAGNRRYETKSAWLLIDKYQVHHLVSGDGQSVVFLHGGASDCRDWFDTMAGLFRYCRMYAPDLLGFGRTDNPLEEYTLADFTGFVRAFVAQTCREPAVMAGHSLGGRIAIELALTSPEMVKSLILVDTIGFGPVAAPGKLLLAGFEGVRRVLGRKQPHPGFKFEPDQDLVCLDRLESITRPALIVWGEFDPYYPVAQARAAARLLPNAQLEVIRWCRHAPHKEKPAVVLPLLASFIAPEKVGKMS
jgi:pimeloyl-ACP methyl ester carboxylesterase